MTIKIIYKSDSIYVSGECERDTIYRFRNKYIYRTVAPKEKREVVNWLIIIAVILIILFIIRQFRSK